MNNLDILNNNKTDLLVSAAKATLGAIPIAGSFLAELVGSVIPNQRIERLSKYVQELEKKLSEIPVEKINSLINNEEFLDLIEEGFSQASRAITNERRIYIASIISNGITDESIQLQESKYLLKILQELNDVEIIWLRRHLDMTIGGDKEFREKHNNILDPISVYKQINEESRNKAALQNSYKEHLFRLELIQHFYKVDSINKKIEFNDQTGVPKIARSSITRLGKLLLYQIGLINKI